MTDRGFKIESYEQAQRIALRGFERREIYMRSLVSSVTGDGAYADGLGYSDLSRQTRRIIYVARKMLKDRDKSIDVQCQREVQGELF